LNPLGLPECIENQFSLEGADAFLQGHSRNEGLV
jgi:hypothetical protein